MLPDKLHYHLKKSSHSVHMIGTMDAVNVHLPVAWVGVCGCGGLIEQIFILHPRLFEIQGYKATLGFQGQKRQRKCLDPGSNNQVLK